MVSINDFLWRFEAVVTCKSGRKYIFTLHKGYGCRIGRKLTVGANYTNRKSCKDTLLGAILSSSDLNRQRRKSCRWECWASNNCWRCDEIRNFLATIGKTRFPILCMRERGGRLSIGSDLLTWWIARLSMVSNLLIMDLGAAPHIWEHYSIVGVSEICRWWGDLRVCKQSLSDSERKILGVVFRHVRNMSVQESWTNGNLEDLNRVLSNIVMLAYISLFNWIKILFFSALKSKRISFPN